MQQTLRRSVLVTTTVVVVALVVYGTTRPTPAPSPSDAEPEAQWDTVLGAWHHDSVVMRRETRVGAPTAIRVVTSHGDTCVRSGGTEVQYAGLVVTVRPFDIIGRNMACGAAVTYVVHETTLVFPRAGTGTVRVERRNGDPVDLQVVIQE